MQYNPTPDNSGALLAQGMQGAAAAQLAGMNSIGDNLGLAVATLAKGFGERRAAEAKGDSYAKVLKMFGPQLGVDPAMLDEFMKMPKEQQAYGGDVLVNQFLPHQLRMQYLNRQMSGRAEAAAAGAGGGGYGGGPPAPSGPALMDFGALGANPNLKYE
jgi:hypothetical protein